MKEKSIRRGLIHRGTYAHRGHEYKGYVLLEGKGFNSMIVDAVVTIACDDDDNVFTELRQIRKPKITLDQIFSRDRT